MTHFVCQGYTSRGVRLYANSNTNMRAVERLLEIYQNVKLLLITNYDVNSMLVYWFFPTEPAMPFSGILPCREYFIATCQATKEPRTPVAFMPFYRLITIAKD